MIPIDAKSLAEMAISALERTAMVLAEEADDASETPSPDRYAWIEYRGPSRGTLVLSANDGFLAEMAASMLGCELDEVDVADHGSEALKELANILGGLVIVALAGEHRDYSLGLPSLGRKSDSPARADAICAVVAEGGALHVSWRDESLSPS